MLLKVLGWLLCVTPLVQAQSSRPKLFQAENGLWGYKGYLGDIVIEPQFQKARSFRENLAAVQKSGQWGYINPKGVYVIKPLYNTAMSFQAGYAKVALHNLWGMVNSAGKVTIKPQYEQLFLLRGFKGKNTNLVKALKDGLYALVDRSNGKQLSPFQYKFVATYIQNNRLMVQSKDKKYGFVNNNGQEVIACKYDKVENFDKQGKALVYQDGKKTYIDAKGKYIRDYDPRKDAPIFLIVEQPPTLRQKIKIEEFIEQNLKYPKAAKIKRVTGIVVVQFVVEMDGSLSNMKIAKGLTADCDKEALRVINASTPWVAGKQRGKPVRVKKTVVVNFKL